MEYFKFKKILNNKNINYFINATKDPNKIHNPSLEHNPIIPGFQLESIMAEYGNNILKDKNISTNLNNIEMKFNNFVRSGDNFSIDFNYNEIDDNLCMYAEAYNEDTKIASAKLKYNNNLSVYSAPKNLEDTSRIVVSRNILNNFYNGIFEDYESSKDIIVERRFSDLLLPSMCSKVISGSVKKYLDKDNTPVYLKHNLKFYSGLKDILDNFYIKIEDYKSLRKDTLHKIKLSGSNIKNKLFDADLIIGIVKNNKIK